MGAPTLHEAFDRLTLEQFQKLRNERNALRREVTRLRFRNEDLVRLYAKAREQVDRQTS